MARPHLLLIDNYDSFTYNLLHYIAEIGADVTVWRNDAFVLDDVATLAPTGIVLSPGPGAPEDAGLCLDVVARFKQDIPILGVCLGHQVIGEHCGGHVVRADVPMHGKVSAITHEQSGIFAGLPSPMLATRYHSLIVERSTLPPHLHISAQTEDGLIMGLEHAQYPLYGVQFHPESIASEHGHALLRNFLRLALEE